ncbi:Pycsar system effector family protein [Novosphingobium sp. Gsoil 351]|uniref:Pycsar system effector family protein n=1 Tax=Novosphingobium sp. Gsoil 351 TaxID=2675225 RepID=UPI001E2FE35A|nr:Pycsar system effector family protein [Novosphingobium sp. Gsoil 351]
MSRAEIVPIQEATSAAPVTPAPAAAEPVVATPSMPSPTGYSNHAIHLVRTSQQMQLALSQMADQKASILMGATFVVFTIAVGQAKNGPIPISLAVLALSAFLSALCAVYAVLPSIRPPKKGFVGKPNKLFFGHFTQLDEEEWTEGILQRLRSDEGVFRTMLHDMYQNGQVLQGKKYKYLGRAYRVFIVGLSLTLIAFIAERFGFTAI